MDDKDETDKHPYDFIIQAGTKSVKICIIPVFRQAGVFYYKL
jgi:hypothetical protein